MQYLCCKCKMTYDKELMHFRNERQKVSSICQTCYAVYKIEQAEYKNDSHPLYYNQIFGGVVGNDKLKKD